jgi:hypothetical protein
MALMRGLLLDVHLDASPVEVLVWSLAILTIAAAWSGLLLERRKASRGEAPVRERR